MVVVIRRPSSIKGSVAVLRQVTLPATPRQHSTWSSFLGGHRGIGVSSGSPPIKTNLERSAAVRSR